MLKVASLFAIECQRSSRTGKLVEHAGKQTSLAAKIDCPILDRMLSGARILLGPALF